MSLSAAVTCASEGGPPAVPSAPAPTVDAEDSTARVGGTPVPSGRRRPPVRGPGRGVTPRGAKEGAPTQGKTATEAACLRLAVAAVVAAHGAGVGGGGAATVDHQRGLEFAVRLAKRTARAADGRYFMVDATFKREVGMLWGAEKGGRARSGHTARLEEAAERWKAPRKKTRRANCFVDLYSTLNFLLSNMVTSLSRVPL